MQVDPRQEIEVKLLPRELETIIQALAQRPYAEVAALINKIDATVLAALKPPAPANDLDPGAGPAPQG
jgi:hypothetical protein